MGVETTVPEVVSIFREIQAQLDELSEMNRVHIRQTAGCYLSRLTGMELTHLLSRAPYEVGHGEVNHRNGSYDRSFTFKSPGLIKRDWIGPRRGLERSRG